MSSMPAVSFGDGTHVVPTDVLPGTYKAKDARGGYWARLSGFGGSVADIIANENCYGEAVATIAPTDKAFKSQACGIWLRIEESSSVVPESSAVVPLARQAITATPHARSTAATRMLIHCSQCETIAGKSSPEALPASVWSSFLRHWTTYQKRGEGHLGPATGTVTESER